MKDDRWLIALIFIGAVNSFCLALACSAAAANLISFSMLPSFGVFSGPIDRILHGAVAMFYLIAGVWGLSGAFTAERRFRQGATTAIIDSIADLRRRYL